jgi:hypothetical protein
VTTYDLRKDVPALFQSREVQVEVVVESGFPAALDVMKAGKKVRRDSWAPGVYLFTDGEDLLLRSSSGIDSWIAENTDLLADDWKQFG